MLTRLSWFRWCATAPGAALSPWLAERLVLGGFILVLAFLTGFSAWVAVTLNSQAQSVARAAAIRDAWGDTRYALMTAESLNRLYRLTPSPDIAALHQRANDTMLRALDVVSILDSNEYVVAVPPVMTSHARYLDAAARMFAAVDAGNLAEANRIGNADTQPAFTAIESRVTRQAALHDDELREHVLALERLTRLVMTTTALVTFGGLAVLGSIVLVFRRYRGLLRQGEDRLRALISQTSEVVLLLDGDGMVAYQSPSAVTVWGVAEDALLNRPVLERVHEEDRSVVGLTLLQMLVSPQTTAVLEVQARGREGAYRDFDVTFRNHLDTPGLHGIVTTWHDVTERKQADASIRASEERYRRIVETSYEGIMMSDADLRITFANERLCEMFGYTSDEVLGRHTLEFVAPASRDVVIARSAARSAAPHEHYEAALLHKDGSIRWATISVSSLYDEQGEFQGRLAMITDISDRRRAEEELYQAQKLESVGRLAAGIAHEINTPIQFIGDNVHFLRDGFSNLETLARAAQALTDAADEANGDATLSGHLLAQLREAEEAADLEFLADEVPRAIEQTLDGVHRVATIVRAMKEFAHPDASDFTVIDVNQSLQSTLTVARNEIKYVADVQVEFGAVPPIVCQPGALNQVFLNLLVNAAQAIEDRRQADPGYTRGIITVRTVPDGEGVRIEIEDTGCGIPDDIKMRVFEQFFTTKSVGRGTGQGLALARRVIIDQHSGSITFTSEVGRGTTFSIWLPLDAEATMPRDDAEAVG